MKKIYNTPETQMQEMEVQAGFLTLSATENGTNQDFMGAPDPNQNRSPLYFEW